jgi:hypothetical protein
MKKLIIILFISLYIHNVYGQAFANKIKTFDRKKDAYIFLENGDSIIGKISDIDRWNGGVKKVYVKKDGEKTETKIEMNDIKFAYLPEGVMSNFNNFMKNAIRIDDDNKSYFVRQKLLKDGYGLFQKVEILNVKNKHTLLLQVLNPTFANKVIIYGDPLANETGTMGFGGLTMSGGDDKSYFIKIVGDETPAFLLKKRDFDENLEKIFSNCSQLLEKLKTKYSWRDFAEYILENEDCK